MRLSSAAERRAVSRWRPSAATALALALCASSCAADRLDLAPPSYDEPWPITSSVSRELHTAAAADRAGGADPATAHLAAENSVVHRPGHRYDLAELIDLAQRGNPDTRVAWERARQAALAVGLAESTYLPQIAAEALVGFQHTPLPIPETLVPDGYFTAQTYELIPALTAKWLLFDFGQRAGAEAAARADSFVANVAFTGAHQKIMYAVSRDYFALGAARAQRSVAERSLATALVIEDAARERRANGLATVVELARAQQRVAQARFGLERARSSERSAYSALVASIGVAPDSRFETRNSTELPLPAPPSGDVNEMVRDALASRPDILAAYGKVKAARAKLDAAEATFYPTVGLAAQGYQNIAGLSTQDSPYYTLNEPGGNVMLKISLPLFDGGDRQARAGMARAELEAANAALDRTRNDSAREVIDAHDALETGFAEYAAALVLERASETAYDAALGSYRHGLGVYTDVASSETALSEARFAKERAHANVLTAAAALAFATGAIRPPAP